MVMISMLQKNQWFFMNMRIIVNDERKCICSGRGNRLLSLSLWCLILLMNGINRENSGHAGEGQKSLRRATAVIGMAPDLDPSTWDHSELDRYGLGKGKDIFLSCVILFMTLFSLSLSLSK